MPEQPPNHCICKLRNIYKAIGECEQQLIARFGLNLNEAMTVCSLGQKPLCASDIANATGMQCPQTSKVIKALENKDLLTRQFGTKDKRNMFFALSDEGEKLRQAIETYHFQVPEALKPIIE
jgi:MarR family transcriptional regulator, organic hydroperoxide resistance regulator